MRDDFTHFTPKGWIIDLDYIVKNLHPCLELIEEIAVSGWAFRHTNKELISAEIRKAKQTLDDIRPDNPL